MPVTTAQAIFAIYLLFVMGIGVYAARFTEHTPSDFYIADRRVGTAILGLTITATVLSSFTVFGIGAQTVGTGLGAFSFLAIAGVFYTIMFATLGVALFKIGKDRGIVTPSEYVRERYDNSSVGTVYLVVTGIFMIALIAGQLLGAGVALDALVGIPFIYALIAMGIFMIIYIHIAGYRGVIWSDAVQAIVLFGVLAGVFLYVIVVMDSTSIAHEAMSVTPEIFQLAGPVGAWTPVVIMTAAIAFAFGVPGYPHSIQRFFSAKSAQTMRHSGFLFALIAIPVYFFGAVIGVWSLAIFPSPANPDYVIPMFIDVLFHPVVFGIAMAGATAAIMSTADSVALTMGSMVSRDIYATYINVDASERRQVRVTQLIVILIIILSCVLAWLQPAGIFELIAFAVVGFATTSAPVFLGAFWRKGTAAGAIASLILGPGITVLFFLGYIPAELTFGMHYGFVGVLIAYVIYIVVSLLTTPPSSDTIADNARTFWGHNRY